MFSDLKIIVFALLVCVSCSQYKRIQQIRSGELEMQLSTPEEEYEEASDDVVVDSIRGSLSEGPVIMNAIRDSETGEMVATDVLTASRVTARFRHVAERAGYVTIGFDVTVPSSMSDSRWRMKIWPFMRMKSDTVALEPIFITGKDYRAKQLRGYERYRNFLASIITDTTDFIRVRQLEIFLERHFPETYSMKRDSSYISEPAAENLFGVTQRDALIHYTKKLKWRLNERRKGRMDVMYGRYVKDPMDTEGVRLDTVLIDSKGDFIYRYEHTFRTVPDLKKVMVSMSGSLYEGGEEIVRLPFPEELTFYISSLSSLADDTPRYRMVVLERIVYDNTRALIDFRQGSAEIDTLLGNNRSEMNRVLSCVEAVFERESLCLDSLVITASCSPEGTYATNRRLSSARSTAIMEYLDKYIDSDWRGCMRTSSEPENWGQLSKLIANDTIMERAVRDSICMMIAGMKDPDLLERRLSAMKEYEYISGHLYPQLRTVRFDFHLHRVGMLKDTIHTTELDTTYMAGVAAMRNLDYKKAVSLLRTYEDYNTALAYASADYNHSALNVLDKLDITEPEVCYLKALVLVRLGQLDEAMKYYELGLAYDPLLEHRANLDPEMYDLMRKRQTILKTNNDEQ